jgi:hypothetical protein
MAQTAPLSASSRQADLFVLPTCITPAYLAQVAIMQLDSFPSEGDTATNPATALTAHGTSRADVHLWHRRLGHLNHDDVLSMVKMGHGTWQGDYPGAIHTHPRASLA